MLPSASPSLRNILIVEDSPLSQLVLDGLLTPSGYHLTQALSGETALAFVEQQLFDVILLDMNLGDLQGKVVAQHVRALSRSDAATTPIIAITANASPEDLEGYFAAGVDDYVAKPFDPTRLAEALARFSPLPDYDDGKIEAASQYAIAQAREAFLQSCHNDARFLTAYLAHPSPRLPHIRQTLADVVHRLKGNAATFGHPMMGDLAACIDESTRRHQTPDGSLIQTLCQELNTALVGFEPTQPAP